MVIENKISKNIYLLGFMGAGKTSVGKILAKKLRLKFCDLDEIIESECGKTVSRIFSEHGEDFFRDLESMKLRSVSKNSGQIVATGGGIVLRQVNWEVMERAGITVYLKTSPDVVWNRIKNDTSRPLLQVEKPFEKVNELLSMRIPLYEKADLIIETENKSPENIAAYIIGRIND
ncbi:MAG TPA: shikimate kinase [Thermodesulfobacteriota bacterium]